MIPLPVQTFPALEAFQLCRHAFINRISGLELNVERSVALEQLEKSHTMIRQTLSFQRPVTAEQTHGNGIAIVDENVRSPIPVVDGLITNHPDVCLGIYVADCCAVYLLDPLARCIGLVHSGKKGTEFGIVPAAIQKMKASFGCDPRHLVVQLSPCIRPPFYEVDFAAEIVSQCRACGVEDVNDSGICTASDLQRYYSYRAEHGKTGRMFALFALKVL